MNVPDELVQLMDKQQNEMEKKMIETFVQNRSAEAIVEIANATLKEGDSTEDQEN